MVHRKDFTVLDLRASSAKCLKRPLFGRVPEGFLGKTSPKPPKTPHLGGYLGRFWTVFRDTSSKGAKPRPSGRGLTGYLVKTSPEPPKTPKNPQIPQKTPKNPQKPLISTSKSGSDLALFCHFLMIFHYFSLFSPFLTPVWNDQNQ